MPQVGETAKLPQTPAKRIPNPNDTSTPTVFSKTSSLYSSSHLDRSERMAQIGGDMKYRYAGSMPPDAFLKRFLPKVDEPLPWNARARAKFAAVYKTKSGRTLSETQMYRPMIKALERLCPNLKVEDTSTHYDAVTLGLEPDLIKPDLTVYSKDNLPSVPTDISKAEFTIEFKVSHGDDGFLDQKGGNKANGGAPFEHTSDNARDTRNQIATYATAQLATQFRTFAFSVLIIGRYARLLRWDRGGAIVTEKFLYAEVPFLAEFFWRYNHASPEDRGADTSVSIPDAADSALVEAARTKLKLRDGEKVMKFEVTDEKTGAKSYYFGGQPSFNATASPTGRCTRGIVVVDEKGEPAYLKDTWRIDLPHMTKEGEIYDKLHACKVPHIPTVLASGDVPGDHHRTYSHLLRDHAHSHARFQPHRHYRLVFREVGRDLTSFETIWEVVNAMGDALEAHKVAFEKANILHRDISVGNILITHDGGGLLIDWDLSKDEDDTKVRRAERTGTWQFMAGRILAANIPVRHLRADDLESVYHVLCWIALRFTPHNLTTMQLSKKLRDIFDYAAFDPENGTSGGGEYKIDALTVEFMSQRAQLPDGAFKDLITDLEAVCRVRYLAPPKAGQREDYEITKERAKTSEKDKERLQREYAYIYDTGMENLETSDWMLNRFRAAGKCREQLQTKRTVHLLSKREAEKGSKKRKSSTSQYDLSDRARQNLKISAERKVPATPRKPAGQDSSTSIEGEVGEAGRQLVDKEVPNAEGSSGAGTFSDSDEERRFSDWELPNLVPPESEGGFEEEVDLDGEEEDGLPLEGEGTNKLYEPETFDPVDIDEGYATATDWEPKELIYVSEYEMDEEEMPME